MRWSLCVWGGWVCVWMYACACLFCMRVTRAHARTLAHTHTNTHAHRHRRACGKRYNTHTHTHTQTHTHTHKHTHTHRYERDKVMSFVPPDGKFKLASYSIATSGQSITLPLYVKPQIHFRFFFHFCFFLF